MSKACLVLGVVLCTILVQSIFYREIKTILNILSISIVALAIAIVALSRARSIQNATDNLLSIIHEARLWVEKSAALLRKIEEYLVAVSEAWQQLHIYTLALSDAIKTFVPEALTQVHIVVMQITADLEDTILATTAFVVVAYQAFIQWLKSKAKRSDDPPNDAPPEQLPKRILFIVSIHSGRSYDAIKTAVGERDDEPAFIDWESNKIDSLEKPSSFVRHFAVCLVPLDIWNDPTKTLLQKFQNGTYWELIGPELIPVKGNGVGWKAQKIQNIDGVLEVGLTTYDDETISQQFYQPLRAAWSTYDTTWWNCFDFAARLGCMILPDNEAKSRLRKFLQDICIDRVYHLEMALKEISGERFAITWFGGFLGGAIVAVAPVTAPAFLCSIAAGLGSMILSTWQSSRIKASNFPKWEERSKLLEEKFPRLGGLTAGLEE
ncbi:uncharacterized protein PAC_19484 [Phialocephala subalpina]|uniref:Uncharacterized protein n=1 Tax=Phialocephala subalpina TaxID=576137 RepID=A0A1L7XX12_9HELO|nr:uncharacterized protein PAC_19484 [Phialocephala subalpina]